MRTYDLSEAAALLKMSPEALRQRANNFLHRGLLIRRQPIKHQAHGNRFLTQHHIYR